MTKKNGSTLYKREKERDGKRTSLIKEYSRRKIFAVKRTAMAIIGIRFFFSSHINVYILQLRPQNGNLT